MDLKRHVLPSKYQIIHHQAARTRLGNYERSTHVGRFLDAALQDLETWGHELAALIAPEPIPRVKAYLAFACLSRALYDTWFLSSRGCC